MWIYRTILFGVPTDSQLAVALLRLGEAHNAPIPPSPAAQAKPNATVAQLTTHVLDSSLGDQPLGVDKEIIESLASADQAMIDGSSSSTKETSELTLRDNRPSKVLNTFKGLLKGVVRVSAGIDRVRGKLGSEKARERVSFIPSHRDQDSHIRPYEFEGHFEGRGGRFCIESYLSSPCITFSKTSHTVSGSNKKTASDCTESSVSWKLAIEEIAELKKLPAVGFKTAVAAGLGVGKELKTTLRITDTSGQEHMLTALTSRDELFNRLIAIGAQHWELW